MKKEIWKFKLPEANEGVKIVMPQGALILSCQEQDGALCLWALVIPEAEREFRTFDVYGTGQPIHYDMGIDKEFIATVQIRMTGIVLHIFERIN